MRIYKSIPTKEDITETGYEFEKVICSKCEFKEDCDMYPLQKFVCCFAFLKKKLK